MNSCDEIGGGAVLHAIKNMLSVMVDKKPGDIIAVRPSVKLKCSVKLAPHSFPHGTARAPITQRACRPRYFLASIPFVTSKKCRWPIVATESIAKWRTFAYPISDCIAVIGVYSCVAAKVFLKQPQRSARTLFSLPHSKRRPSESVLAPDNNLAAYCVYTFGPSGDKQDDWLEIGIAVPHADGHGFRVILQALPFDGRLIFRRREVQQQRIGEVVPLEQQVEAFERAVIERCLLDSGGRINVVMERLSLPRRTLNEKMSRLGIHRHRVPSRLRQVIAEKRAKIGQK